MKTKPIIIVTGEPKSVFFEIFFKSQKLYKSKSPLVLISSKKILKSQMKKFKFKKRLNLVDYKDLEKFRLNNNVINLIDIDLDIKKTHIFINKCFDIAFKIINSNLTDKFINGPVNKSKFLNKKYLGITEYISKKFKIKKNAMLIYNKNLSVCPITTHLPLKLVSKKISQKLIKEKVMLINNFYKKNMGFVPKIGVAGLNPHCESILKLNEDIKIVSPAIKNLKKRGFQIYGPFPTDTLFLKQNRIKYDVILGMYHDQVLTPLKTLKEYDAINITLGLPFYRVSPDHGPNEKMFNKNLSTPISLIKAIQFLDRR
tara:strand:+ start:623 stop:1564 length:942 start_codon:yes stop_codon:yes gene_type:complete